MNIPWMAAILPEGADDPLAPYLFDLAEQLQREFFDVLRPAENLAWLKVACRLWVRLGYEVAGRGIKDEDKFLIDRLGFEAIHTYIFFAKELIK